MTKYLEAQGNKICGYGQCADMGKFYTGDKHGGLLQRNAYFDNVFEEVHCDLKHWNTQLHKTK